MKAPNYFLLIVTIIISAACANETTHFAKSTVINYHNPIHKQPDLNSKSALLQPVLITSVSSQTIPSEVSAVKKINALYHSEITNAKEFRKEYKQISSNYRKKLTGNYKKAITDEEPKKKGKGGGVSIISLVCGLTGLIVAGLILGTLAITFGLIGLLQGKRPQMALIGLVIGIIDIAAVMIALGLF